MRWDGVRPRGRQPGYQPKGTGDLEEGAAHCWRVQTEGNGRRKSRILLHALPFPYIHVSNESTT